MPSHSQIVKQMRDALAMTEPELDTSTGSVARRMLDAVAEVVAEAYVDQQLLGYTYDIDAKMEGDLDEFCMPPGSLIQTRQGPTPIEDVEKGDEVLTHTGSLRSVFGTMYREVDEDLVELKALGAQAIQATSNHPVLVTKKSDLVDLTQASIKFRKHFGQVHLPNSFRLQGTGSRKTWGLESIPKAWIPAGDLGEGDIVWGPSGSFCGVESASLGTDSTIEHEGLIGRAITKISRVPYKGPVYNFEVEGDNSYTTHTGVSVHNCELFGISRLMGKRANGVVVFARQESEDERFIVIPTGTQIIARLDQDSRPVFFQTLASGMLSVGDTSVSVPVQAVESGPMSNMPAGSLNILSSPITGVSSLTNPEPLTGGTSMESDAELRDRWKATVFRNMSGTSQMYLALALNQTDCYAANVIGSSKRRFEAVQVDGGEAVSTIEDARYIYPGNVVVGRNIRNGDIYTRDIDYFWNYASMPPKIEVINDSALSDGSIVELQYEYTPVMGRNDPANNITNRIDIWAAGVSPYSAVQALVFRSSPSFNDFPGNTFYRKDFILGDGGHPLDGSTFVPLAYGPVMTVPPTITIAGNTYGMVTADHPMDSESNGIRYAYRIVHHNTEKGWAPNSLFGLEWSAAHQPPTGSNFEMEYFFNGVPHIIQRNVESWRLVSTDALVHQAIQHNIRVNVVVQYHNPLQANEIVQSIEAELDIFFRDQGIGSRIQPSDIITKIANTSGVDAVRWLHGGDYEDWDYEDRNDFHVGLQRTVQGNVVESYVDETGRPLDIPLGDSDVAVFGNIHLELRAANTFGAS